MMMLLLCARLTHSAAAASQQADEASAQEGISGVVDMTGKCKRACKRAAGVASAQATPCAHISCEQSQFLQSALQLMQRGMQLQYANVTDLKATLHTCTPPPAVANSRNHNQAAGRVAESSCCITHTDAVQQQHHQHQQAPNSNGNCCCLAARGRLLRSRCRQNDAGRGRSARGRCPGAGTAPWRRARHSRPRTAKIAAV